MIQFIRYSPDPLVQAAASIMVNNMAGAFSNPAHFTIGAIISELTRQYGDYANSVRIWVH
jgi:hypothetical protein